MQERISPLLTDQYQLAMAYSYFVTGQHTRRATFEMFFRKAPFSGSYAVFAGLDKFMEYLVGFAFTEAEISFLRETMPYANEAFFEYLKGLDYRELTVRAPAEGTLVFPNEPVVIIEGPLGFCQLVETTLLVLVNYATLVCTNAARMRVASCGFFGRPVAAGTENRALTEQIQKELQRTVLLEFGARRAQGPDGACTGALYALKGGFNATSNVLTAQKLNIPSAGTMAHAFILSFTEPIEALLERKEYQSLRANAKSAEKTPPLEPGASPQQSVNAAALESFPEFAALVLRWKRRLCDASQPIHLALTAQHRDAPDQPYLGFLSYQGNECELAAFCVFAFTQPGNFTALVDTYDTLRSGLPNFVIVASALVDCGVQPGGIRLDSGDLAYLSAQCKSVLLQINAALSEQYDRISPSPGREAYREQFLKARVCASNDITEEILVQLGKEGAKIDTYGIGTHLITCKAQPALGGVYKLVEIDGQPRMKMTEEISKASLPGQKDVYRLYLQSGQPYVDIMKRRGSTPPVVGEVLTCVHPHDELKRVLIKPASVQKLHQDWIANGQLLYPHRVLGNGKIQLLHPDVKDIRLEVLRQICWLREDHKRYLNPTPYKVSVDERLNALIRQMALDCKTVQLVQ